MDDSKPNPDKAGAEDEISDKTANIILLVTAVVVIWLGIWLVNAMLDARQADECLSSGRRGCMQTESPAR